MTTENRYHDHNNLSAKNRGNINDTKKKEYKYNKKNFIERPDEELRHVCGDIADNMRFDCFPQGEANENNCKSRGKYL